jgi:hypothetical protein
MKECSTDHGDIGNIQLFKDYSRNSARMPEIRCAVRAFLEFMDRLRHFVRVDNDVHIYGIEVLIPHDAFKLRAGKKRLVIFEYR